MRLAPYLLLCLTLLAIPATAQRRTAPKKDPTFHEAVDTAKKAFDAQEHGAAVSALQAAIRAVQKLQRVAILEALPKPAGFEFEDRPQDEEVANPFGIAATAFGMVVHRDYRKGDDKRLELEITANSPVVQMVAAMMANPAIVKADGGELVEYGTHKAVLKKNGENNLELTILMHDKHIVKATTEGLTADELFAVVDQALVDRLEKPLGK